MEWLKCEDIGLAIRYETVEAEGGYRFIPNLVTLIDEHCRVDYEPFYDSEESMEIDIVEKVKEILRGQWE